MRRVNFTADQPRPVAFAARARLLSASIALSVVLCVSSASAATDIQGTPDDLQLNVQDATIVEIMNALSARFKITFKARSHDPRVLTGVYSGTLRETLTRVLNGNDYILQLSQGSLEVLIIGPSTPDQQGPPPRQVASAPAATPNAPAPAQATAATTARATSLASSRPFVPHPNPSLSSATAPPLSSFAVVPPVTP